MKCVTVPQNRNFPVSHAIEELLLKDWYWVSWKHGRYR